MSNIWTIADNQTIVLTEQFCSSKLDMIMDNWNDDYIQTTLRQSSRCDKTGDDREESIKQLQTMYNKYRKQANKDGTISVTYRQRGSEARKGGLMGRYFAKGSQSLQNMKRTIRHTICSEIYWDVDMVNAHPTILSQYCRKNGIKCPILDSYVADRREIIEQSGIPTDVFKQEFLAILNGRQFTKHYRIPTTDEFFIRWNTEATAILSQVVKLNPTVKPSKRDHNENGSVTNRVICSIENEILFYSFNYLLKQGYSPEVLCFDGLMVRQRGVASGQTAQRGANGEMQMLNITLANMSDEIAKVPGGYQVQFIVKPMTDGLDLSKVKQCKTSASKSDALSDLLEQHKIKAPIENLSKTIKASEPGFANLYCNLYALKNVKICCSRNTSGYIWDEKMKIWMSFHGTNYIADSVSKVLSDYFREQIDVLEKINSPELSTALRLSIGKLIETFETKNTRIQTLNSLSHIFKLATKLLFDPKFESKINNYEDILPISGGKKIDLRTLEVSDRTVDDYFDHELDVNFTNDPDKLRPICNFMKEIMDIHDDNRDEYQHHNTLAELEAFQVNLGYCISGCTKEKMFSIWHGAGSNGKSTVADFVSRAFGKYSQAVSRSIIEERNKKNTAAGEGPTSALISTKGVHLGFIHETSANMRISAPEMKGLTSGGADPMTGRELYGKQETFVPKMKLAILCNRKPIIDGTDPALVDRVCYIPFLNKFKPTPQNHKKIEDLRSNHMDAFFSWVVMGSKRYFDTGFIPRTTLQQQRTRQFADEHDTLARFINDYCVVELRTLNKATGRFRLTSYPLQTFQTDYLGAYPSACVENLKGEMQKKGFEYSRNTKGQYSFLGIRVKTQDDYKREEDDRRIDAEEDLQEFDEDLHDKTKVSQGLTMTIDTPVEPQVSTELLTSTSPRPHETTEESHQTPCHSAPPSFSDHPVMRKRKHSAE